MKKILATICLALTIALTVALPAFAQQGAEFTIYPSYEHMGNKQWIIAKQPAGSTIKDYITLENLTDSSITISLNSVDAEEKDGTFVILEETPEKVGAWLAPQANEITLNPKEKKKISVTIAIPQDTKAGQYTGTILASHTGNGDTSLKITTRIGVRVYLTVIEPQFLYTSVFTSPLYVQSMFFTLSFIAVIASILYNLIHYFERRNAKKSA